MTTITPANATDKTVLWASSNIAVVTVSAGVLTPVAAGTATITVTTDDGNKTDTCTVTVTNTIVAVTGVSLNPKTLSLVGGDATGILTATISPANATNKTVSWKSSDTGVVTVSSGGVVTPLTAGTATITVTTDDGNKTDTCTVTVISYVIGSTGPDGGLIFYDAGASNYATNGWRYLEAAPSAQSTGISGKTALLLQSPPER